MGYREAEIAMEGLGTTIMKIRKERGMTRKDLAEEAGVHRMQIQWAEEGKRQYSVHVLMRILNALDCFIDISPKDKRDFVPYKPIIE